MNDKIDHMEEREAATMLVRRVQEGDKRAEGEMVERYSRGLRFLLRRTTRDPEHAEDLLQETWIVALERIRGSTLDSPERLAGFLAGVARHLALNDMRKAGRQKTSANTTVVELIPDEENSPVRQASRAEVCQHVKRLLGELHQRRDREILNRFYVLEQDKEMICSRLGVDSTHFNRVLYRARQRLRDVILKEGARSHLHVVN
jgi:RNA polymerase sigma-70 factor (ECF subfamily)